MKQIDAPENHDDRWSFPCVLVRASAGTGKTYQLTGRLLQILLSGASPETLLATTFTRKAAGEILSRVLLSLAEAAVSDDPKKLQSLRLQVDRSGLTANTCADLVHRVLRDIHRLRICTLDALFSQLARSMPFDLEMPPGWRLTDEIEEVWLRSSAVTQMIEDLKPTEIETLISMLSRGDNKRNVARELESVIEMTYALSRSAGEKAWDTIDVPKGPESAQLTATSGLFRAVELKQKSLVALLQKLADAIDARDFDSLVGSTILNNIRKSRLTGEAVTYSRAKFPSLLDEGFDHLVAAVRTEVLSLLRAQNQATGTTVATYDTMVQRLKMTQRLFGFDDIAVRLGDVFGRLKMQSLDEQMEASIDHLLLDEFQDTSPAQWRVLRVLAHSVTQTDRSSSFFCVGDTKQAIYGWRGGVAVIFDVVQREIAGVQSESLNQSHRSSAVVLDSVTDAFKHLSRHPIGQSPDDPAEAAFYQSEALQRFEDHFPKHTSAKELAGYVRLSAVSLPKVEKPDRVSASMIMDRVLIETCNQIEQLHLAAPHLSIGVLTRTNPTVAQLIHRLEARGLDVSAEGGNPLDDSVAVRWILSALMMTEHPGDGRWRLHVAHSPLAAILSISPNDDPLAAANELRDRLCDRGLPETVLWLARALLPIVDSSEQIRLRQFIEIATLFRHTASTRVSDFVDLVRIKRVQRPRIAPIRVMTVHQSKGLEFDAVFLPELHKPIVGPAPKCVADRPDLSAPPTGVSRTVGQDQWQFLPDRWRDVMGQSIADQWTEALCLLYVAMTRSRQGLYLITTAVSKPEFANKTAASLLFHAWGCESDPTIGDEVWYESGEEQWWDC